MLYVMAVLEGLVILTIIIVGVWVGYAYWDEYTHNYDDSDAKAHHTNDNTRLVSYHVLPLKHIPVSWR